MDKDGFEICQNTIHHNQDRLTNQPRAFELSVSFIGLDIKSFKKIIQKVNKKKKKQTYGRGLIH